MKFICNITASLSKLSHYCKYTLGKLVDIFGISFLVIYVTINSFFVITIVFFLLSNPT